MATHNETRPTDTSAETPAEWATNRNTRKDTKHLASTRGKPINLAWMVRGVSQDGRHMIDALFDIMRGVAPVGVEEKVSVSHVIQAAGMLLDRGFGKAVQTIITEDSNANPLDTLTLDQLATIRQALATPATIVTIDIPPAT